MNKILFYFLLIICLLSSCNKKTEASRESKTVLSTEAQEYPSQRTTNGISSVEPIVRENYTAKNNGWLVSLEEAYKESQKTGKPILANFTGSDWCGWCIKLDESVFQQAAFSKWSNKQFVLLEIDFPKRFKVPAKIEVQNEMLKEEFDITRFPTVYIFDVEKDKNDRWDFKKLYHTGYCKSLAEFQKKVQYSNKNRG